MVFDTSCWATASGNVVNISGHQHNHMFAGDENPVQRRPKIDYFDPSSAALNVNPIVSHISSNGYYGYCPTPTASSFVVDCDRLNDSPQLPIGNITMADAVMSATSSTSSANGSNDDEHLFRQRQTLLEKRKRSIAYDCDDEDECATVQAVTAAKRCRNADGIEDVQMSEDGDQCYNNNNNSSNDNIQAAPERIIVNGSFGAVTLHQLNQPQQQYYFQSTSDTIASPEYNALNGHLPNTTTNNNNINIGNNSVSNCFDNCANGTVTKPPTAVTMSPLSPPRLLTLATANDNHLKSHTADPNYNSSNDKFRSPNIGSLALHNNENRTPNLQSSHPNSHALHRQGQHQAHLQWTKSSNQIDIIDNQLFTWNSAHHSNITKNRDAANCALNATVKVHMMPQNDSDHFNNTTKTATDQRNSNEVSVRSNADTISDAIVGSYGNVNTDDLESLYWHTHGSMLWQG